MSSRCLDLVRRVAAALVGTVALTLAAAAAVDGGAALRVCADPDNLPYSHADKTGFENRIAELVAAELKRPLEYFWLPQRRGFVRKTLGEDHCDLFIGVPAEFERVLATQPYYRSSYVFVTRTDDPAPLRSFDDSRLPQLRIGVQLIGNDLAASPPGHALTRRGAVDKVVGYTVYGDGPAAERMVQALKKGQLDAALIWGPQAGYFAKQSVVPLQLAFAKPPPGLPLPFEFDIAMGVRRGDKALRDALNSVIARRRADIDAILATYDVPRTDVRSAAAEVGR
jgi:mxaJ protein